MITNLLSHPDVFFIISMVMLFGFFMMENKFTWFAIGLGVGSIFFLSLSLISSFYLGFNEYQQELALWKQFSSEHQCKIVERDINGGAFSSSQNAWLCDDGVKYYKDVGFAEDLIKNK